jgi:hypothetical protein
MRPQDPTTKSRDALIGMDSLVWVYGKDSTLMHHRKDLFVRRNQSSANAVRKPGLRGGRHANGFALSSLGDRRARGLRGELGQVHPFLFVKAPLPGIALGRRASISLAGQNIPAGARLAAQGPGAKNMLASTRVNSVK